MIDPQTLPNHWALAGDQADNLTAELALELPTGHMLDGTALTAVARRTDCDDVLFELSDGRFALVHLTWSGSRETDPAWPGTTVYDSLDHWRKADAAEQAVGA